MKNESTSLNKPPDETKNLSEIDVSSIYKKLEEINIRLQKLEEHFLVPVINNGSENEI